MYGHVKLALEPGDRGSGVQFASEVVGGSIPREYVPAVEKGVREAAEQGILCGYPLIDVSVRLLDGSYHDVDSSELAFKIAGSLAFQEAARRAGLLLLEPVMALEVVTPDEFLGEVMGDLAARRARIGGLDARPGLHVIAADAPLATMFGYATDLRSRTQGRATFTMQFAHYPPVPAQIGDDIVAKIKGA
jgi:elongation factor G